MRYARIRCSGIILTPSATPVPNFVSVTHPIAELARGDKLDTQSLTHSPSLIDMPRTEAYRFRKTL